MKAVLALIAAVGAIASPVNLAAHLAPRDLKQTQSWVTIHESCNVTQKRMIERGLNETFEIVSFAQNYVKHNGPDDAIFQMYFGSNNDRAYANVLGVYESILYSDKTGVVMRCDNPDGNCQFPGWRGHWRGNNATSETVICDASYTDRRYAPEYCMKGYQLTNAPASTYWGIDLLHRLLHVPQVTDNAVQHYTSGLAGAIQLAKTNATYAPFDSDVLQYFSAHVYILEVVKGGEGCIGDIAALPAPTADSHGAPIAAATSSGSAAATSSAAASSTTSRATSTAASATSSRAASSAGAAAASGSPAADCHTHADGSIHCGAH